MKGKSDRLYLLHIVECIGWIENYCTIGKEEFLRDRKTQDAVIRNIEIIGEASKKISQELKDRYIDIPWKKISGTRDRIVHDYFGVDYEIIWVVVEKELEVLKREVSKILKEIGN